MPNRRCSSCGYYLPITKRQCKAVEDGMSLKSLPSGAAESIRFEVRLAMIKCGVCGWRCEVVAGTDGKECEFWWRDE